MKGWRTILVNAAVLVVGLTDIFMDGQLLGAFLPAQKLGAVIAAVAIVNKVLRLFTTTPLGKKE